MTLEESYVKYFSNVYFPVSFHSALYCGPDKEHPKTLWNSFCILSNMYGGMVATVVKSIMKVLQKIIWGGGGQFEYSFSLFLLIAQVYLPWLLFLL
jgi:hypothetical protein